MSEEKKQERTNTDVQAVYQKSQTLSESQDWQMPQHEWTVERLQQLQKMALPDLISHLRIIVAAKVSMDNLNSSHQQKTKNYTNNFNQNLHDLDERFDKYMYLNQHPAEIAYCRKRKVKQLPREMVINNRDTKISKIGFFCTILFIIFMNFNGNFMMGSIFTGLPIIVLIPVCFFGFALLYIAARLHLPFSQPWYLYHNHRIRALVKRIKKSDEHHCQEAGYDERGLKQRFKYWESVTANRGIYFENMNAEVTQTNQYLKEYVAKLREHTIYFPTDDMQDVRHVFRIYKLLMNGRATTWKEATVLVDEDERTNRLKQTLVDEIRSAKNDITMSIDQASAKITHAVREVSEAVSSVQESIEQQTSTMEELNNEQMEIMNYQTDIMKDSNDRINNYVGRRAKYY